MDRQRFVFAVIKEDSKISQFFFHGNAGLYKCKACYDSGFYNAVKYNSSQSISHTRAQSTRNVFMFYSSHKIYTTIYLNLSLLIAYYVRILQNHVVQNQTMNSNRRKMKSNRLHICMPRHFLKESCVSVRFLFHKCCCTEFILNLRWSKKVGKVRYRKYIMNWSLQFYYVVAPKGAVLLI